MDFMSVIDIITIIIYVFYIILLVVALFLYCLISFTFKKKNKIAVDADLPDDYDEQIDIKSVHEAGHAVMAYLQDTKDFEVFMSYDSAKTVVTYKSQKAEDVKKMILVKYSGAIAEELLLGELSAGSIGILNSNADFPSATELIKAYIVMTEPTVSKTLLNEELADLIISASNSFYKEATEILSKNKEMLVVISDELKNKDSLKKNEIIQLLKDIKFEA